MNTSPNGRLATVVHELAATLEREGNVRTIFGEPMKLDTRTLIPVATVSLGGVAAGVRAFGAAVDTVRRWFARKPVHVSTLAGGGRVGVDVRPVGFLSEEDGRIVFTPIEVARRTKT